MYEAYYKLHPTPFRLTPDPYFFFESKTHQRGMAYLRFAFYQREGFVVITGAPGTGKTELMLNLIDEIPQQKITLAKIVSSNLDADELLQLVASSFGVQSNGVSKGLLLKTLEDYFADRWHAARPALLIIDEAHNLSVKSLIELSMLSNFQIDGQPLLQCFLLGQEPLETKLNQPKLAPLKQRVLASTRLQYLNLQETRGYIRHRLMKSGWNDNPAISEQAFALIHAYSNGVPRKINALSSRVLLQGYLDNVNHIDEATVRQVIEELQQEAISPSLDLDLDEIQPATASPWSSGFTTDSNAVDVVDNTVNETANDQDHHISNLHAGIQRNVNSPVVNYRDGRSTSRHPLAISPARMDGETGNYLQTGYAFTGLSTTIDFHVIEARTRRRSNILARQLPGYIPCIHPVAKLPEPQVVNQTATWPISPKVSPPCIVTVEHTSSVVKTSQSVDRSVYEIYGIRGDDELTDPLNDIKKSSTPFKQKLTHAAGVALILALPAFILQGWYYSTRDNAITPLSQQLQAGDTFIDDTINVTAGKLPDNETTKLPLATFESRTNPQRRVLFRPNIPTDFSETKSLITPHDDIQKKSSAISDGKLAPVEFAAIEHREHQGLPATINQRDVVYNSPSTLAPAGRRNVLVGSPITSR